MIFVTGGYCQGKRAFSQSAFIKLSQDKPIAWCDGGSASWDTFMKEKYGWNFHLFIRRVMLGEAGALPVSAGVLNHGADRKKERIWTPRELESLASFVVSSLIKAGEDRILVTDDIGCGIVPVDYFERICREETGRICCLAAEEAREVWRVCCGLGQRIK